jgi:hypothetical protein
VTEGHGTPEGVPWKGVRMRNQKLRNICPSGAFSSEMTSSNVTRRDSPGSRVIGSGPGCSLGHPRPINSMATGTSPFTGYLPLSRHFIFIITFLTKVCCFRICFLVLYGVLHNISENTVGENHY